MEIIETTARMRRWSAEARARGHRVGLVPTMGYLHEGHLSLARAAREQCDRVVMSVFVNPTQFGPEEDLAAYPRDLERDAELARGAGVDALFHPSVEEMYPQPQLAWVEVDQLGERLCGRSRPGHFRGVCTVVLKLIAITAPDAAFFGMKDAQQLFVLRRMARDLALGVEVVGCPTVREPDGVAMSSRNVYLEKDERRAATVLRRALDRAEQIVARGEREAAAVDAAVRAVLAEEPLVRLDYLEIVDTDLLQPVQRIGAEALVAVAAHVGRARLIDNTIVKGEARDAP